MKRLFITGLLVFFGITFGHAQKSELTEMVSAYVSQLFPNEKRTQPGQEGFGRGTETASRT